MNASIKIAISTFLTGSRTEAIQVLKNIWDDILLVVRGRYSIGSCPAFIDTHKHYFCMLSNFMKDSDQYVLFSNSIQQITWSICLF